MVFYQSQLHCVFLLDFVFKNWLRKSCCHNNRSTYSYIIIFELLLLPEKYRLTCSHITCYCRSSWSWTAAAPWRAPSAASTPSWTWCWTRARRSASRTRRRRSAWSSSGETPSSCSTPRIASKTGGGGHASIYNVPYCVFPLMPCFCLFSPKNHNKERCAWNVDRKMNWFVNFLRKCQDRSSHLSLYSSQ